MTRPALADVLAALTSDSVTVMRAQLRSSLAPMFDEEGVHWPGYSRRWTLPDPREALEVLVTRGLLPEHWTDSDYAPRWWCALCGGSQRMRSVQAIGPGGVEGAGTVGACYCVDERPTLRSLVAVASLGLGTLARVESLADVIQPGARVVWRVMATEEILRRELRACPALGEIVSLGLRVTDVTDAAVTVRVPEVHP